MNKEMSYSMATSSGYSSVGDNSADNSPNKAISNYALNSSSNFGTDANIYSNYLTNTTTTTSGTTGAGHSTSSYEKALNYGTHETAVENKLYNSSSGSNLYQNSGYDISMMDKAAPFVHDEALAQEVLAKAGPAYTYQRKDYSHDIGMTEANTSVNSSYHDYATKTTDVKTEYSQIAGEYGDYVNVIKIDTPAQMTTSTNTINQDPDPIRVVKPNGQNLVYKQQVNIRYLQPPTPPPPAPIIIRERQLAPAPAQPPIIIRQTAPPPPTPPPLTIREKAPTPPPVVEPTIIERPIPAPPAPPRQVIIERVPAPPAKPRPIIYEKWLPYKSIDRPVIVQKIKTLHSAPPPKNVIIEYEKATAVAIREVIEEGVFRADPATYQSTTHSNSEIRYVDRITDLPIESSRLLAQLNIDSKKSKEVNLENASQLYAQLLSSSSALLSGAGGSSTSSGTNLINSYHNNSSSNQNLHELSSSYYSSSQHHNQHYTFSTNNYLQNVEYETITTSVPESLAKKIIAEAKASGTITKSAKP